MAKDVTALIEADHREVEKLFDQLKSGKGDRAGLAQEVGRMLLAHSKAEEALVYPVAAKDAGEKQEIKHSKQEHQEAEQLIHQLQQAEPDDSEFDQLVDQLVDAVSHHVQEEESEVLPAMRESLGKDRLAELATEFSDRRKQELDKLEATAHETDIRIGEKTSKSVQYAQAIKSVEDTPERPGRSLVTTNHDVIRRWVEARGGQPATVPGTEHGDHLGVLRVDFPDYGGKDLQHVSWDEWFDTFDKRCLNFLYQEQRSDGSTSNFFRLENPEREQG